MKRVIIKSLTLTNWRGERSRTTQFDPVSTTIAGENGLGKSRHFDAFMWLLFGKDKEDRKDFNIKTIVDGQPLTKTECEVAGVLNVDGKEIALRRAFVEEWVKPRGQVEQVFKGNKTECYWNDAPVSITEYQKRVAAIVDDSVFKMVTNPLFFASMPWKNQREQLFQLAGTVTDHEIARSKPEFSELLDRISGKSLDDFKRELSARKKRLKDDLAQIQPRIDQTQRLMPEMTDFATLEVEEAAVESEIAGIDKAIADVTERVRQQYEAVQERQSKINALKTKRQQVVFDAQSKAREEAHNANASRRELQERINAAKRGIHAYMQGFDLANTLLEKLHKQVQDLTSKSEALRSEWYKENEAQFNGATTCRCCGQELPDSMKAEALDHFNKHKQSRLEEITRNGKNLKAEIEDIRKRIFEVEQNKNNATSSVKAEEAELHALEKQLTTLPEVGQSEVTPENIKEYTDLTKQIADLEADMVLGDPSDTADLRAKKIVLQNNLRRLQTRLADRDLIARYQTEIAELEEQGKQLAQQIADAEREEYTVQQFTKAKIGECEKRINSLFTRVTFRLFDYTIDGNEYETCVPLVNGVPFDVANTAGQVNAGLDIINALSKFYGVTAPIFIDNRESVNKIIDTQSQVINLVVTEDKQLVIK